jgi:pimeloyl-ACP methyl ester carboxylesterase
MGRYVLVPGAGGVAWYWHRLVPLLERVGYQAVPVDLPGDDEDAGLPEYAALVGQGVGGRVDAVLVARSMGGFTAARVGARVPLRAIVLLNAMIPALGETPGAWWENTGAARARADAAARHGYPDHVDLDVYFRQRRPGLPPGSRTCHPEGAGTGE